TPPVQSKGGFGGFMVTGIENGPFYRKNQHILIPGQCKMGKSCFNHYIVPVHRSSSEYPRNPVLYLGYGFIRMHIRNFFRKLFPVRANGNYHIPWKLYLAYKLHVL